MGNPVTATLAYGYNLGIPDDFKAAERDEYGGPAPTWYNDEGPAFVEQLYDALYAASGLPAEPNADNRQAAAERHFGVEPTHHAGDRCRHRQRRHGGPGGAIVLVSSVMSRPSGLGPEWSGREVVPVTPE